MGNIPNYKSNSDEGKLEEKERRLRPVEDAEAPAPKRTNWVSEFILGDARSARESVVRDVIFPGIKRMLVDAGSAFLTMWFDGVRSGPAKRGDNYSSIRRGGVGSGYFGRDSEPEKQNSTSSIFVECGKRSRGDAELVLDQLRFFIETGGFATVRQYYDLMGKSSVNVSYDNHYGWTDLSGAEVRYKFADGLYYIVGLPRPKFVDD